LSKAISFECYAKIPVDKLPAFGKGTSVTSVTNVYLGVRDIRTDWKYRILRTLNVSDLWRSKLTASGKDNLKDWNVPVYR
jgi:hypothetical protein